MSLSRFNVQFTSFICNYWLVVGIICLLSGLFWLPGLKLYTKLFYLFLAVPGLLALLVPGHLSTLLRESTIQAFLVFTLWLLSSLIWTHADESLFSLAKRPLYVFLMFSGCALLAYQNPKLFERLLHYSAWLAVLGALAALLNEVINSSIDKRLIGTGALRNPLLSSQVFGFFCVYWLYQMTTRKGVDLGLACAASLTLLVTLLATGSRTPILAVVATGLWLAVIHGKRARWLSAGLLLSGAIAIFSLPALLKRGFSYRPEIWLDAVHQAGNHPWIGLGYNSEYSFQISSLKRPLFDPHNVELAVLLQLGIIGLTLWLLMYCSVLWRCWKCKEDTLLVMASALVVHGFFAGLTEGSSFLSRPNENWFLTWIPLAIFAGLSIRRRLQTEHNPDRSSLKPINPDSC